ncbi:hypothetical protein [Lacunimicrobium album]
MDTLAFLIVMGVLGYWAYRHGKRDGSRSGFNVGLRRNRRFRR